MEEQPLDEFFARFLEGEYVIFGETVDGVSSDEHATFTLEIADGPVMISPEEDGLMNLDDVVIV